MTERPRPGEPVRVLRVITRLNMGGPALHVAYLSAGLAERGYETTLVTGSLAPGENSMAFVAERLDVDVVQIKGMQRDISPFRDVFAVIRLARVIRRLRPHIVHTHTAKAGAVARLAALFAGRARPPIVVHTFHGHALRGYFDPMRTAVFRVLERLLARVSTALVAVSPEVRDDLVSLNVAPAERFAVIRLGIELEDRVSENGEHREETRRQLGISPERFAVGWIGRMTGVKGMENVLLVFRRLRARGVDAVLCLVGDGPDRSAVEKRARELGVMRQTLFLGFQEEVARFYSAFDALVLPSLSEGTPVTAIEALAAKRPVVATRVGGVEDVVREGEDGFLVDVDAGAIDALADRLARLAGDPELREQMGRAGRERVLPRYSVQRLLDDLDLLYRTLLEDPDASPSTFRMRRVAATSGRNDRS